MQQFRCRSSCDEERSTVSRWIVVSISVLLTDSGMSVESAVNSYVHEICFQRCGIVDVVELYVQCDWCLVLVNE